MVTNTPLFSGTDGSEPEHGIARAQVFTRGGAWLFETQLRAIAQSAAHCDVRVMFPMVLAGDDFQQAAAIVRRSRRAALLAAR